MNNIQGQQLKTFNHQLSPTNFSYDIVIVNNFHIGFWTYINDKCLHQIHHFLAVKFYTTPMSCKKKREVEGKGKWKEKKIRVRRKFCFSFILFGIMKREKTKKKDCVNYYFICLCILLYY